MWWVFQKQVLNKEQEELGGLSVKYYKIAGICFRLCDEETYNQLPE